MPRGNHGFPELPAEKDGLVLHLVRKVDQSKIDILEDAAIRMDFSH